MVGETGMDTARAAQAWVLLVDGHRVDYGGGTRRIYPSHAQVARELGLPTSTVTRWAARTGVAKARAAVVAGDVTPNERRLTTDALVLAVATVVDARVKAGHLLSDRLLAQVVRLAEWAIARRMITTAAADRWQPLLRRLLEVGRAP